MVLLKSKNENRKNNKTKLSVSHGIKKGEKKWNIMQENMT